MIQKYLGYLAMRGCTEKTLESVEKELYRLMDYTKNLLEAKTEEIQQYHTALIDRKLKKTTISGRINRIKGFYKYLKREGKIIYDPAESIILPPRKKELPKHIPNHSQIERLLSQPDTESLIGKRDKAILELLYTTGMRKQEVVNLDIYDIDLKAKQVFIREGKGKKDRVVPIGSEAIKWLEKYIEIVRPRYTKDPNEKALFISKLTAKRIKKASIYDIIERYRDNIKDGKYLSPHRIRHACAVEMLRNGANIRVIQKLLGHKRLSTTQIYTQLSPEDMKQIHNKYHPRNKMKIERSINK
jgi:site-specific recombinase XerD